MASQPSVAPIAAIPLQSLGDGMRATSTFLAHECPRCGANVAVKANQDSAAAIAQHLQNNECHADTGSSSDSINVPIDLSSGSRQRSTSSLGGMEDNPRGVRSSSKFIRDQLAAVNAARQTSDDAASLFGFSKSSRTSSTSSDRSPHPAIVVERGLRRGGEDKSKNSRHRSSPFEEDTDAGALQWNELRPLDKPDDEAAAATMLLNAAAGVSGSKNRRERELHMLDDEDVRVKAEEVEKPKQLSTRNSISGSNGNGMGSNTPSSSARVAQVNPPSMPANTMQSGDKRNVPSQTSGSNSRAQTPISHSSLSQSHSQSHPVARSAQPLSHPQSQPAHSSVGVPIATTGATHSHNQRPPKRRRSDKEEDMALAAAYDRQISTLNEAMRQLLAFVSTPFSSGTDAYVDDLIAAYRGEYMKEQMREGRTQENKRYARAMAAYFLTYYHSTSVNLQLAAQHSHQHQAQLHAMGVNSNGHNDNNTHYTQGTDGSLMAIDNSLSTMASSLLIPSDPFEGLHHPLYSHLSLLLYTVIDSLLMDTFQISVFSIYLERLDPYWILDPPPQSQTRLLLLAAYAMKLAYVDNHSVYLPYLSGLYANFSQMLTDYLHGKPGVKLGIQPQHLAARFRLLASLSQDKGSE